MPTLNVSKVMKRNWVYFFRGMRDGLPIGLGYFAVSFAFGIQAAQLLIKPTQAFILSATNLTSAGQVAALTVIESAGTLATMALTQLVINLRYCLMSCSLAQKLDPRTPFFHRFFMAGGVTDEIFGVGISLPGRLSPFSIYGMMVVAIPGWSAGTLFGALAGNIFPATLTNALGMALFAMFVAIVVPVAKHDKRVLLVSLAAILLSCLLAAGHAWLPLSSGMRVIVVTLIVAGVAAVCAPLEEEAQ